jgi:serine/threonine protein kinase
MGAVYLARVEGAAGFAKPVVIKRVLPHLSEGQDSKEQFIREARILSNLRHPGIVGVIDFAEERGALLMVLEYVHGYNIGQWLKYVTQTRGGLAWEVASVIIVRVLEALHYAHTFRRSDGSMEEIVHRDVSPGNVVLDVEGNVRLLDFGIALISKDPGGYKTQDGTFKGKLPYVAPEIYGSQKATPKSDVYACGVVLYQMLVGVNPFAAKEMAQTVRRVLTLTPEPVRAKRPDVPVLLDELLAKAMAKDPDERFESAERFASALRSLLTRREDEVQVELSSTVQEDFYGNLPSSLGVRSLAELDSAWQGAHSPSDEFTPLKSSVPPTVRKKLVVDAEKQRLSTVVPGRRGQEGVSNKQLMVAVLGAALLAGTATTAVLLVTRPTQNVGEQRFLVVEAADGSSQQAKTAASATPVGVGVSVLQPGAVASVAPSASAALAPSTKQAPPKGSSLRGGDAARLSRVFARKQGAVQRCFQAHTEALEGSPNVSIRFKVDASGKVQTASVQPAALNSTALGQCLTGVARSTEFGPQPEARAFSIPIHARTL